MRIVFFAQIVSADVQMQDRYALPPTKVNIIGCRDEALRLHPGTINEIRKKNSNGVFLFQIRISTPDGLDKLVFCDAITGTIIPVEIRK